jgi:hypothetical protein
MTLLFKTATSNPSAEVGQSNFKDHYPSVEGTMRFAEIATYIRQATELYIIPYIGREMYDLIADDFVNNTTDAEKKRIISLLQDSIANYTIYHSLPFLPFVVSTTGFQKTQSNQGTTPSLGEKKDTRWNAHLTADKFLDFAIKELDTHNEAYYAPYISYSAKHYKKSIFFSNAESFDEYLGIQESRRTFAAFVPYLKKAEDSELIFMLGETLLDESLILSTPIYSSLVKLIRRYLAPRALYGAIPYITLVIESDGFKVLSKGDGIEERNGLKSQQHENAIIRLGESAKADMEKAYNEMVKFLEKNKTLLISWEDSELYESLNNSEGKSSSIITNGNGGIFLKF